MDIQRWIARRELNWQRLDSLLNQIEKKGLKSLRTTEVKELSNLYHLIVGDLTSARAHNLNRHLIQNLQALKARAYKQVNQGARQKKYLRAVKFYSWGLPATVQQTFPYIAVATALFILGILAAWLYIWQDPNFISLILPSRIISKVRDDGKLWMDSVVGIEPLICSGITINHNLKVCFSAVAGGITAGVFTIYVMVFNGLLIGAVANLVSQNNLAYPFWAFIFPHGSLELPAIILAGSAGLLISKAILFPGQYCHLDAIKIYGSQAIKLVFGIVPMLVVAGLIEGFFSPNPNVPNPIKYLTGIALFVILIIYFSRKSANS
ncbi:MAG: stage II sporulation protein M [Rivularia sp. (in: Bacteria)]|nr:stage II sporulation protein M [Rivularia sp. MS3]